MEVVSLHFLPTDPEPNPLSYVGFFFFFFAYTQFELRPDLPALVYAQSFGRQRFSEAAELVPPSVAEDEAAGCVRAGRAWRRQGDPVLQNRGGKTDGERQDNENYRF